MRVSLPLAGTHVRDTSHQPLQAHLSPDRLGEVPGKVCVWGGRGGTLDVTIVTGQSAGQCIGDRQALPTLFSVR